MAFSLRSLEANKKETLSLSLRLRDGRTRTAGDRFGVCQAFVMLLSSISQVIVLYPSSVYSKQIPTVWSGFMDDRLKDILDTLPTKSPRSRLEPYREFIQELRRRGRAYRDIASILSEKCQVQVSASGVHDFVRTRYRSEQKSRRRAKATIISAAAPVLPQIETAATAAKVDAPVEAVRRKIAALKARKSVVEPTPEGFRFDPSEPLRLKKSGKKTADE
jgi:hypothetical protein